MSQFEIFAGLDWSAKSCQVAVVDRANCRALRSKGCRHARALRSVVDRPLGVVCTML